MRGGGHPTDPGYGEDAPERFGTLTDAAGNATRAPTERGDYRAFYAGMVRAIADGAHPPVAAADAVDPLRLIERGRQSAHEGRSLAFGSSPCVRACSRRSSPVPGRNRAR